MISSNTDTVIHGVLINITGVGVLITGESGTGKSECALGLISVGHKLVADDVIIIEEMGGELIGIPPERFKGLLEIRGLGIIDVRELFSDHSFEPCKRVDLWIEFHNSESSMTGRGFTEAELLTAKLPKLNFCIELKPDLVLIVETAVKLFNNRKASVENDVFATHDLIVAGH